MKGDFEQEFSLICLPIASNSIKILICSAIHELETIETTIRSYTLTTIKEISFNFAVNAIYYIQHGRYTNDTYIAYLIAF